MIQSLPYQFEHELFTNLCFSLLRNAVQPLILIFSHRNCHTWNKHAPVRHLQNDERLHVPDTGVPTQTRATDTGKSPPRTKYINNLRKTKNTFL